MEHMNILENDMNRITKNTKGDPFVLDDGKLVVRDETYTADWVQIAKEVLEDNGYVHGKDFYIVKVKK